MKYPVYTLSMNGNEKKYVMDCLDSTWISSKGKYINLFEEGFAKYINVPFASSVNNGTVALHLALLALDIKAGDEIILPTFTYVATANAVMYMGAIPVFVDSLAETWQIDPKDVERKITSKTKAIIAVHLYGQACEMDELVSICKKNNIYLIEDCAEAIGTLYKEKHVGGFGDISTFSFFGNKTITTGEGGMVVTNNKDLCDKCNNLKNQGISTVQYWHDKVGYNFRMTNICAAIGLAQLEQIEIVLNKKIDLANAYRKAFEGSKIEFHKQQPGTFNSYWMCSLLIENGNLRDKLRNFLLENGIDTRPLFYPVHTMPMFKAFAKEEFPIANQLSKRGINLPSYPELSVNDVAFISSKVIEFVNRNE